MVNRNIKIRCILLCMLIGFVQCKQEKAIVSSFETVDNKAEWVHFLLENLNDAIVNDIFSPPVASRIYAYTFMAGYAPFETADDALITKINTALELPEAQSADKYLSSLIAMKDVGTKLVFSTNYLQVFEDSLSNYLKEINFDPDVLKASQAYALKISDEFTTKLISADGYDQTRTMPKYDMNKKEAGRWIPTPPDYLDALEPHWNKIQPLFLNSADQFIPEVRPGFDLDKSSSFYKDLENLYAYTTDSLDSEKKEIAEFWDCNPFVTEHVGHFMKGVKKITPGGHWVGINKIICQQKKLGYEETIESYTMLTMGLMDAFISCWDEKYRSSLIRPETLINLYIDPEWKPLLITPHFPEYTSGHSVASGAASVILTEIHGDNIAFRDDTEIPFGLPARNFNSFYHAAAEAAVSRYYGGIHYMPAIEVGLTQGKKIGTYALDKMN